MKIKNYFRKKKKLGKSNKETQLLKVSGMIKKVFSEQFHIQLYVYLTNETKQNTKKFL